MEASIIVLVACVSFLSGIIFTVITLAYAACRFVYGDDATIRLAVEILFGMSTTIRRTFHAIQGR